MAIEIKIDATELKKVDTLLKTLPKKVITRSVRQGFNRGIRAVRSDAIKLVFFKRKFAKGKSAVARRFKLDLATGNKLEGLVARLKAQTRSINIINFVKGPKRPRDQKGISPKDRKPLRFEIIRGKSTIHGKAFIAVARRGKQTKGKGNTLVFIRRKKEGRRRGVLIPKAVPGVSSVIDEPAVENLLRRRVNERVKREIEKHLKINASKKGLL